MTHRNPLTIYRDASQDQSGEYTTLSGSWHGERVLVESDYPHMQISLKVYVWASERSRQAWPKPSHFNVSLRIGTYSSCVRPGKPWKCSSIKDVVHQVDAMTFDGKIVDLLQTYFTLGKRCVYKFVSGKWEPLLSVITESWMLELPWGEYLEVYEPHWERGNQGLVAEHVRVGDTCKITTCGPEWRAVAETLDYWLPMRPQEKSA